MVWRDERARAVGLLSLSSDIILSSTKGHVERRSADQSLIWRYQAEESFILMPSAYQQQIFALSREGWLHAIEASSGKGLFKIKVGNVVAQPSIKEGLLLLPERGGELHAFDLEKREVVWSYDTEGQLWASPIIWQRFVYAVSWSGVLYCMSLKTGDDVWQVDLGSKVTATPIIASGVLYLVTESSDILAFDARTGKRLFHDIISTSPIQASPLVLGDKLIVAALDGTVKAYV
ncbi:MAG: PQQ-binding-like beta-propeller repeat protein [Deinococcales bacterium]